MTISEIAKLAGVSSAAVSRYLNDGSLSAEKRERIAEVIAQTNYRPSENARSMRTKKSRRIGVLVPQIDSESAPRMLAGITQVMDQEGYQVLLMNSDLNQEKELEMLETFSRSQVDGLILIASILTPEHETLIRKLPFPLVILGQRSDQYSCVYHNDRDAAYEMMKYLLSVSRYPAYLGVTRADPAAGEGRFQGASKALQEAGFSMETIPGEETGFSVKAGHQSMEHLLAQGVTVDGVFCATDKIAVGVIACLQEHGIKVPEQVNVTGIGHGTIADLLTPKLTTVHYHYRTGGKEAASMLLELIRDPEHERQEHMLDYKMIYQKSTR